MESKRVMLNHFKRLQQAVINAHGEAFLNLITFMVEIRLENRVYQLYPLFVTPHEGNYVYSAQLTQESLRFIGWRPYFNREVPEIGKKLSFKKLLQKEKITVPKTSQKTDGKLKDVILKMGSLVQVLGHWPWRRSG